MKQTIFDFQDYKAYLKTLVDERGRGMQSELAKAADCQTAYLSRVLNAQAHLSPEQGEKISTYLGHAKDEAFYFTLLIMHDRAGTHSLKERLREEMGSILEKRRSLKSRFKLSEVLSNENQLKYYDTWYYSAIHILLTIPRFQSKEAVARALKLPLPVVSDVIAFLVDTGLVNFKNGKYTVGQNRIHLPDKSPLVKRQHTNWRLRALEALDAPKRENLHFTSVVSLSQKDVQKVRDILVKAIEDVRHVVKPSPEEVVYCYEIDLFSVVGHPEGS